jgi:hypothetical protein
MRKTMRGFLAAMAIVVGSPAGLVWTCAAALGAAATVQSILPTGAQAGELYVYECNYQDSQRTVQNAAPAFAGVAGGIYWNTANECLANRSLEINATQGIAYGHSSQWDTVTPSEAIKINTVYTPPNDVLTDCYLGVDGYNAGFFWGDNGQNFGGQRIFSSGQPCDSQGYNVGTGINIPIGGMTPSRYFGWSVTCGITSGCKYPSPNGDILGVHGIGLGAEENTGPTLLALGGGNLYYQGGKFVRGDGWGYGLLATDDSGVCDESASVDGRAIAQAPHIVPNQTTWLQCGTSAGRDLAATANTTGWADGSHTLTLSATNAAGVTTTSNPVTVTVDNAAVGLSVSGPTDAPVTAGTQYVLATASAGVSGVAGIACQTDGGPYQWYPVASAQIPVAGLGDHVVSCYAQNRAIDPSGAPASSAVESWRVSIRYPTVISASFARIADKLRCKTEKKRVRGPWVKLGRGEKLVRVRGHGHTRTITIKRCHPRLISRRKRVKGRWRIVRVPVFPHVVQNTTKRVGHGRGTTISGWLGITDGTALAGQPVRILTAPDNGRERFTQATVATTASNGTWTAHLLPGPSRLVEAVYDGGPITEPASSAFAHLVVPAKIKLSISPRRVAWSGTITLTGRLLGGYVPRDGVALRLRVGYPGGPVTLHALRTNRKGAFRFSWSFGSGNGIVTWPIWAATVSNETDYAFAASSSRHIPIRFGDHPPPPRHPRAHRHRRGAQHARHHRRGRSRHRR